jgi:hypothetical protein
MVRGFFPGHRIPILIAVDLGMAIWIDNRSKGRGDDNSFHRRRIGLDCLQDAGGSLDRGIEEILDRVLDVVMERRRRVKDIVEGRV